MNYLKLIILYTLKFIILTKKLVELLQ